MATLTLTVPDITVNRIRIAFGHDDPITGDRVLATVAEIQDRLKSFVKQTVMLYEGEQTVQTTYANMTKEVW